MGFSAPDEQSLNDEYNQQKKIFEPAMNKVEEILTAKIGLTNIKNFNLRKRIKSFESFYNKIIRKQINNNYFINMEDFIGIRVICLYYSELEEIDKLIEDNFNVIQKKQHSFSERVSESGYRSDHYILKLSNNSVSKSDLFLWPDILKTQCEIQIRTELMHAWANVSHDTLYKKVELNENFRREMYAISSLFFFVDQRFDTYYNSQEQKLKIDIGEDLLGQPCKLEPLTQYIKQKFTSRPESIPSSILEITQQLKELGYSTIKQIDDAIIKGTNAFVEYEKANPAPSRFGKKYDGVGVIRISIAITDNQDKKSKSFYVRDIAKYREMISK